MGKLTVAVEGCCHGELDKIYSTLQYLEKQEGKKIDLLLCCGDFQAVRNLDDLETMACPPKYRAIQTFYKYFSGEKVAPYPTIFIGGNHEAANHLWELYYGGWAAPNIYFMGFAGAVRFGGLRIAGLSGIFKSHDYTRGHHERAPLNDKTMRSIYHVRDFEVYRLMQLHQPVDVFLSHDWPIKVTDHGNKAALLAKKMFLRQEVEQGELGSPACQQLLEALQPRYWFSAHLHTKFAAVVPHASGNATHFLALDKCLPGRDFLQVFELDAPCDGPPVLEYDEEWLAVMRSTHHLINLRYQHQPLPGMGALRSGPKASDVEFVRAVLQQRGGAQLPDNFSRTVPAFDPKSAPRRGSVPQHHMRSPQTEALLELLGLPYNLDHAQAGAGQSAPGGQRQQGLRQGQGHVAQPGPDAPGTTMSLASAVKALHNPEEIDLDLDDMGDQQQDGEAGDGDMSKAEDDDFVDDGDDTVLGPEEDPMFKPFTL